MELKELAIIHPYYCPEGNYYSNKPNQRYNTMTDFLDDFEDTDVDLNLMFRWDIHKNEEDDGYRAECFLILQRKGIFMSCMIDSIKQEEVERFIAYANKHKKRLEQIWKPL